MKTIRETIYELFDSDDQDNKKVAECLNEILGRLQKVEGKVLK